MLLNPVSKGYKAIFHFNRIVPKHSNSFASMLLVHLEYLQNMEMQKCHHDMVEVENELK